MKVEQENCSLAKVRWFMAAKILLIEEHAHGVTEVGIDDDVITVDLFAARKLDAAGTAAIKKYAGDRCGGVNLSSVLTGHLGKGLANSRKVHP